MAVRIFVSCAAALFLAACAGGPGAISGEAGVNYAEGSVLGATLPSRDQAALQPVFTRAVEAGGDGERHDWEGPGSFGWVKAGARIIGDITPAYKPPLAYPVGLYIDEPLETELGLFALTRNANVRLGPSTDHPVLMQLQSGDAIDGLGRVVGKEWVLAGRDGRVAGYIHESLMVKAPGAELELAGGPTRKPVACREFEQRISYGGRSDKWNGVACLRDGKWRLEKPPENAPVQLF